VPWSGYAPDGLLPEISFDRVLDRVRYVELTGYHNFNSMTIEFNQAENAANAWSPRTEQSKAKNSEVRDIGWQLEVRDMHR
jgi:hypothetical protein